MTLVELRRWHWNQMLNEQRLQKKYEERAATRTSGYYHNTNKGLAKAHQNKAKKHASAVKALNQVVNEPMEFSG